MSTVIVPSATDSTDPVSAPIELTVFVPVPLEFIALPPSLNGSQGLNRSREQPLIDADRDIDAICCFMKSLEGLSELTHTAYHREAERILLWAVIAKRKPLSSLDATDIGEYRKFLKNPKPVSIWVGKKHRKDHPEWKPFTGKLSARSVKHADIILNRLFRYLTQQKYLKHNPYAFLTKLKHTLPIGTIQVNRSFTASQWDFVINFLKEKIGSKKDREREKWIRTHMLISVFYMTGLRIHELAKARIGDIVCVEREHELQYWLNVVGKGQKLRDVPLPPNIYKIMNEAYLELTGFPMSEAHEDDPIIPPLRRRKDKDFIKPLAIHKILKEFFGLAADELSGVNPEASKKFAQASTHWLRHTHGTHAVDKNIPLTVIKDNMGHQSLSTTTQYLHADRDKRYADISKLEKN